MISSRSLAATAALLALALVPTVVHTYVGITATDGRTSGAVAHHLDGVEGVDTKRSVGWVTQYFGTEDFVERRYGTDVTLFVARGYDAKRMYHHPELALAYGRSYDSVNIAHVSSSAKSVPVYMLTGQGGLACYALLYNDEFVEKPLQFQARQAFSMLFSPRRQMTLFFARGSTSSDAIESPAVRILLAAVESFLAHPSTESR
jgi:hypothetical protein